MPERVGGDSRAVLSGGAVQNCGGPFVRAVSAATACQREN